MSAAISLKPVHPRRRSVRNSGICLWTVVVTTSGGPFTANGTETLSPGLSSHPVHSGAAASAGGGEMEALCSRVPPMCPLII